MKHSKLINILVLVSALVWLAGAVILFALHFCGTGMIPLYMPVVILLGSILIFIAYFHVRKWTGNPGRHR